jgi:hypothetical protein
MMLQKKRIKLPTLIAIIVLLVGASVGIFLVQSETGFLPRATPEFAPKDLTVTNVSENSFTISWVTQEKAVGFLKYGEEASSLKTVANDDRDTLTGSNANYTTHHITVRGLEPETAYYFKVASGGEGQYYDNNGQPYQVTTAPVLGTPPPADTAYGEVLSSSGVSAEGALFYVSLPDGGRLSTLVRDGGQWALSLSTARTKSLQKYLTYDPTTTLYDVLIKNGASEQSKVVASTANDQPLPTISLGQDYDFSTQSESVISENTTASASARTQSGFNLEPLGEVVEATEELTILNPSTENEGVNTTLPEFHGTAPAGTVLTIEVHSENQIQDSITVSDNNTWVWTPPENLEPGEHTITASFTDSEGILQTITRSFTVYASEQSDVPAFVSTPSATPKATPKATPQATPLPTAPSRVSQPASGSGIPKSGNTSTTILMSLFGIVLLAGGVVLYKWPLLEENSYD